MSLKRIGIIALALVLFVAFTIPAQAASVKEGELYKVKIKGKCLISSGKGPKVKSSK